MTREIRKLLIANRGEIAIRIHRACAELGIRTIGIHSFEDRYALHRFKANEAYSLGEGGNPVGVYLDIDRILEIAESRGADAIHPGYGFLSERADFAAAVEAAGMIFVGPPESVLSSVGDKVSARTAAVAAGLPIIPGSPPIADAGEGLRLAGEIGFPVMVKASGGGGGRGMRVVREEREFVEAFESARREASSAFGNDEVFIEKLVERPKHIEIQILADAYGDVAHLYERDCSIQRRHQKVLELAPAPNLDPGLRTALCDAAVQFAREVGYRNAGTVEFLVSGDDFYFIEMNPRLQVEHTVTEEITGIDIVASQIRIAMGHTLEEIGASQELGPSAGLRDPVPRHDGESREPIPARLRSADLLSLAGRPGRAARRGQRFSRRLHHALLRLAAREAHDPCARSRRGDRTRAARARRVPGAGRRDERGLPEEGARAPDLPGRELRHAFHRRDPRAAAIRGGPRASARGSSTTSRTSR